MASVGSQVTFSVEFTNTSAIDTDPTTVRFLLREEIDGTELEWHYNAAPVSGVDYPVGMNPVVKDSTGNYHVAWAIRKPERLTGYWQGAGAVTQASETTVLVRHSGIAANG